MKGALTRFMIMKLSQQGSLQGAMVELWAGRLDGIAAFCRGARGARRPKGGSATLTTTMTRTRQTMGEPPAGMKTAPPLGASGMSASPQRTGALVRAALPLLQSLRVMLNEL